MEISDHLSPYQWQMAVSHIEEVFRVCLFPVHVLTMVQKELIDRGSNSNGLQVTHLQPVTRGQSLHGDRLREQMAHIFQLHEEPDEQKTVNLSHRFNAEDGDSVILAEKQVFIFDLQIFPPSPEDSNRPPIDV